MDFRASSLIERINIPAWQQDHSARASQDIINPASGADIISVPIGNAEDVSVAFDNARRIQADWAATPPSERAMVLKKFADLVHRHRDQILDLIQLETGKARFHALDELMDVLLVARYYAKKGPLWLRTRNVPGAIPGATKARVMRFPVGVVGIIAPWNYPLSLAITDGLAAIMAGNAIVQKPDSQTPLAALAGVGLLEEAGMPKGLWQIVTGSGGQVGSAIADSCDFLMFTGSSKTGQALGGQIGNRLVGYSAELGGKNPMIVGEGCDYERVAEIATRACFANAGQLCISIERVYAVGSAYEGFSKAFARRISKMKLAVDDSWETEMGTLSGSSQFETVCNHVDDAVAKGAKVLVGAKARPDIGPFFYEPTLLAEVPEGAICRRNETFGPVVSIYPATSLEDAVAQANDTDYGLNSCVFCAEDKDAQWVAERLNSGMVTVNEGYAPTWSALDGPSGGWGISGIGSRHGQQGLLKYTKAKTIGSMASWLHMGGPACMSRNVWAPMLEQATNAMKWMP